MRRPASERSAGTDRVLVERFSQWIPGWGRKQLSLSDLYQLCNEAGIETVEYDLTDADGYALWVGGTPYIYIGERLTAAEKVITGYHELAHILYHPEQPEVLRRCGHWNWSKCDRQAEIVGCVAWMPDVGAMTVGQISGEFAVSREVASFRASLRLWPVDPCLRVPCNPARRPENQSITAGLWD